MWSCKSSVPFYYLKGFRWIGITSCFFSLSKSPFPPPPKSHPVSYLCSSKCVFKLIIQCVNMSDHTVCFKPFSCRRQNYTQEDLCCCCLFRLIHTGSVCVCVEGMLNFSRRRTVVQMSPERSAGTAYPQTPTAPPALDKSSSKSKFPTCLEECNYARTPRCVFSARLQVVGEDVIAAGFSPGLRQR